MFHFRELHAGALELEKSRGEAASSPPQWLHRRRRCPDPAGAPPPGPRGRMGWRAQLVGPNARDLAAPGASVLDPAITEREQREVLADAHVAPGAGDTARRS